MTILGSKTWKMENIAENDRKEGIRTRQGIGELIKIIYLKLCYTVTVDKKFDCLFDGYLHFKQMTELLIKRAENDNSM